MLFSFTIIFSIHITVLHQSALLTDCFFFSSFFFTSINDSLIGNLQHKTQLGVHGVSLFGVHSKESCIEVADIL